MKSNPGYTLLTGAGGGIGLALADFILARGDKNLLCQYRSRSDELKKLFQKYDLDPEKHCFQADLTQEGQVRSLHEHGKKNLGTAWAVVNLAGGSTNGMSWKLSLSEFQKVMDMNLTTTFLTCKEFVSELRENGGGRIINISSIVAFSGVAGASHYCAAKAAIVGFTKALASEVSSKNITANVLALGYFNYGLIQDVPADMQEAVKQKTPLKRFGNAGEIGGMIDYLRGPNGGFATGQVFHLNGGLY